jgi:transposase InsO family protein
LHPNHYYNYKKQRKRTYQEQKQQLKAQIKELYHERGGTIGHRMICDVLNRKGITSSYKIVYGYMKEMKIKATILLKPKPYVSKGKKHYIFDNQVDREFYATRPNEIWCSDFTQFKLKNGKKRYNCTILDLYDRSVVATLNSKFIDAELAVRTLEKALILNKTNDKITLHTDQGSQFASRRFINCVHLYLELFELSFLIYQPLLKCQK